MQQHCSALGAGCGTGTFTNTLFEGNAAPEGGGGALFTLQPAAVAVYCDASPGTRALADNSAGCSGWSSNTAFYGQTAASVAKSVRLLSAATVGTP